MHRRLFLVGLSISICLTVFGDRDRATARTIREHRLVIAANNSMRVSNESVDRVIAGMNKILSNSFYSWDTRCDGVKIVRKGDVIINNNLPGSGSYDELRRAMHAHAPGANVLIVNTMTCSGVTVNVAGCGVIGDDDLVVGKYRGYDDILWTHERGHNVGLDHSAESPSEDNQVPQNVGMRFMFWILGLGHKGKTSHECTSIETLIFHP